MPIDAIATAVAHWFQQADGASLKLPNGWFGRPFDGQHRLTGISVDGQVLTLVLDDRMELSISDPESIQVEPTSIQLSGSSRIVWSWREYVSEIPHLEQFDGGQVEFSVP